MAMLGEARAEGNITEHMVGALVGSGPDFCTPAPGCKLSFESRDPLDPESCAKVETPAIRLLEPSGEQWCQANPSNRKLALNAGAAGTQTATWTFRW